MHSNTFGRTEHAAATGSKAGSASPSQPRPPLILLMALTVGIQVLPVVAGIPEEVGSHKALEAQQGGQAQILS